MGLLNVVHEMQVVGAGEDHHLLGPGSAAVELVHAGDGSEDVVLGDDVERGRRARPVEAEGGGDDSRLGIGRSAGGERDYSVFTLAKSKEFRKVGPVSLALRKTDVKHKRYNLELVVDDVKLEKKNVNLYEPVYVTLSDRPQPVELLVNQIGKDEVRGYVSQPKYKKSELASDAAVRTKLPAPESPR